MPEKQTSLLEPLGRIGRNLMRLPGRTWHSLRKLGQRGYRMERAAERYARRHLPRDLYTQLCQVPGFTTDRKCALIYYLAATTPATGNLVEIGAYKGKSTAWLTAAARQTGRHLVSIDPQLAGSAAEFARTVAQFDITRVATLHCALSHDIGVNWNQPIAFLWIDGSHEYPDALHDLRDFAPHVQPGGYILLDDADGIVFPGVARALDETLRRDPRFDRVGMIDGFDLYRRRP